MGCEFRAAAGNLLPGRVSYAAYNMILSLYNLINPHEERRGLAETGAKLSRMGSRCGNANLKQLSKMLFSYRCNSFGFKRITHSQNFY